MTTPDVTIRDSTLTNRGTRWKKQLQGVLVVDMDIHIHESPGKLAPYCEKPWRKALEFAQQIANPNAYMDRTLAPVLPSFTPLPSGKGGRRQIVDSAAQMREDLDELSVDVGVLFPDCLLYHATIAETAFAVAVARAYNRWVVEEWLSDEHGLKGAILVPHHDPVAGAEEIRRYAGHRNVVCVYLPTSCVEPLYGNRRYDPVYDAAQEAGLPVVLHSVASEHPAFPFQVHGYETLFAKHAITHPFSLIANLVSMLETGVPVRFPDLKIAFTEGGIGWVPWMMMRLDKEWIERRREVPMLRDKPSTFMKKMYFSTQPIEESQYMRDTASLVEMIGEESVIFASDWPHHDFDHPTKVLKIPVSKEGQRKIFGENAVRLLGLTEEDLRIPERGSSNGH